MSFNLAKFPAELLEDLMCMKISQENLQSNRFSSIRAINTTVSRSKLKLGDWKT